MKAKNQISTKMLSILLSLALILSLAPISFLTVFAADYTYSGGSGTAEDPYQISTPTDMQQLSAAVNEGTDYSGKYFVLTFDVSLSSLCGGGESWTPIGNADNMFAGTFDGAGFRVTDLYIKGNGESAEALGLFGYNAGTIKNLGVEGSINGNILKGSVGGIAGVNYGTISGCYSAVEIALIGPDTYIGGICGMAAAGVGTTTVKDCYNIGALSDLDDGDAVGGIVGEVERETEGRTEVVNCYNQGEISAGKQFAGGIVATVMATNGGEVEIAGCYNMGKVSAVGASGGIVAANVVLGAKSTVIDCYNTAEVSAGGVAGGIAGMNVKYHSDDEALVKNCYSIGNISGDEGAITGGVVALNGGGDGESEMSPGSVVNSYYLQGTATGGINGADENGENQATVKTADDFAKASSFTDWDFTDVWEMNALLGRPILKAIYTELPKPETPDSTQTGTNSGDNNTTTGGTSSGSGNDTSDSVSSGSGADTGDKSPATGESVAVAVAAVAALMGAAVVLAKKARKA